MSVRYNLTASLDPSSQMNSPNSNNWEMSGSCTDNSVLCKSIRQAGYETKCNAVTWTIFLTSPL